MIQSLEKIECCGCGACEQICPKQCISMAEDAEGFLYPVIDYSACVDCHTCEKVCPMLNKMAARKPKKVVAARNLDEGIRKDSSSGGVFTLLAEQIIAEGGVVFGVRFNKSWEVVCGWTDTIDELKDFRGSKYVQSRVENTFAEVESFLRLDRKVLFTGTPCQIAGLKSFLHKSYDNLYTVDFICHGVPSPLVWRKYLREEIICQCGKNSIPYNSISMNNISIESIKHRDKIDGWSNYSFALCFSMTFGGYRKMISYHANAGKNPYLKGFLSDLYLRPSCHQCVFRKGRSGSDLTIADLWGKDMSPEMNDDRGTSAVYIYNDYLISKSLNWQTVEVPFEKIIVSNPSWHTSVKVRNNRNYFFRDLQQHPDNDVIPLIMKYAPFGFLELFLRYIRQKMKI